MVSGSTKNDDLGDPYELLGLEEEAGDKEIQAAYRRGSLKCHPDRNPDDPDAAQKFDQLTRAKDLLLNPIERAGLDSKRKAKRELEERFAQEDAKRRKLRESLEAREGVAARVVAREAAHEAAKDARRRFVQAETAARIQEREAKVAERQAEVVAEAFEACQNAAEAQLRVRWREPGIAVAAAKIREALAGFAIKSIKPNDSGALVQLGSREDALRAVLQCRERKHQLPFRVALASAVSGVPATAPHLGKDPVGPQRRSPQPDGAEQADRATGRRAAPASAPGSFDDWEASMLNSLQGLAEAQRGARGLA